MPRSFRSVHYPFFRWFAIGFLGVLSQQSVSAQDIANYSLTGNASVDPTQFKQEFLFDLKKAISSSSNPEFGARTYSQFGGTNLARHPILAGGFDPFLALIQTSSGVSLGGSDGGLPAPSKDALLTWPQITVDPISPGGYQFDLFRSQVGASSGDRHWAVDLAGPADGMILRGVRENQSSAPRDAESLRFGATCQSGPCIPDPAQFIPNAGQHRIDTVHVGEIGAAKMVIGSGTNLTSAELKVGAGKGGNTFAQGELIVENGGVLDSSGNGALFSGLFRDVLGEASGARGTATIRHPNSHLITDNLVVGEEGKGVLNIASGGSLTSLDAWIGRGNSPQESSVRVSGAGSIWNLDELNVGLGASGRLTIENGSNVAVSGEILVHNKGVMELNLATATTSDLYILGGTLQGRGSVSTLAGNVVNGGSVVPGPTFGRISIAGDYHQNAMGNLEVEIGGTTASKLFDRLTISEGAFLDGAIDVGLLAGFHPSPGSAEFYTVLEAQNGRTGKFSSIPARDQGQGLFLDVIYNPDDVQISLLQACPGDANGDGEFNTEDLVLVLQGGKFETAVSASWSEGDWNGDGLFSSTDFVFALQTGKYETGPYVATPIQAVPEPASMVMLFVGAYCIVFNRRRKQILHNR